MYSGSRSSSSLRKSSASGSREWKAESFSSTQLMVDFHRYWTGSRSKSAALREAVLNLLRDPRYQHPFYWANHILIGDSR